MPSASAFGNVKGSERLFLLGIDAAVDVQVVAGRREDHVPLALAVLDQHQNVVLDVVGPGGLRSLRAGNACSFYCRYGVETGDVFLPIRSVGFEGEERG